jgi:hypothetical protein
VFLVFPSFLVVFFKRSSSRCIDKPTPIHHLPLYMLLWLLVTLFLLRLVKFVLFCCCFSGDHGVWWWRAGGSCIGLLYSNKFLSSSSSCVIQIHVVCHSLLLFALFLMLFVHFFLCYSSYWSLSSFSCIVLVISLPLLILVLLLVPLFLFSCWSYYWSPFSFSHVGPIIGHPFPFLMLVVLLVTFFLFSSWSYYRSPPSSSSIVHIFPCVVIVFKI